MNIVWFWVLAAMLTAYAVLDGYDLGVAAVFLWLTSDEHERRLALASIGPVWNGNEVWLLAGGGMLVVSFPRVYAAGFSGFYLALMVVLWLLIGRGVSLEFRSQVDHALWRGFWDACLAVASALIALLLGVALGNLVRGLPIRADGTFQGTFSTLLNPYSLLVGILSLVTLAGHGVNYLRVKTAGGLQAAARRWSRVLGAAALALALLTTGATFLLRSGIAANFRAWLVAVLLPLLALAGLIAWTTAPPDADRRAWRGSVLTIVALLATAGLTIFPDLLHSTVDPAYSLTVYNAAAAPHGLRAAFMANIVGLAAVVFYSTYIHRTFRGKVKLDEHGY